MLAYQNPEHPSYHGPKNVTCFGCGKVCSRSAWGAWCHPCNVSRMDRISANLESMVERAKFDEAVRKAVEFDEKRFERLLNERNAILRAAGGTVTATKDQHRQASYWSHQSNKDGSETYRIDV